MIEDASISTREQDRFDHHSVALQLAELVRSVQHPTAVGLLGPFGSGKSSVVRLLAEHLRVDNKLAVLQVSAEHHSGTARARAMLYGLLGAAHREKLISDETLDTERACLEGSRQRTLPRPTPNAHRPGKPGAGRYISMARAGAGWIAGVLAVVWLLGMAAVFVGHLLGLGHGVVPWRWFASKGAAPVTAVLSSASIVVAAIGAAKDGAIQAFRAYDISVTTPRPDSTDELEQVFSRLIDEIHQRKLKRLVIAIDDIDRLNADEVLEALATIRSLLLAGAHSALNPVFIISCDEDIVREAIMGVHPGLAHRAAPAGTQEGRRKATEEAAQEYLNKLFSVRITLPAHHDHDLLEYAEHLLVHPDEHPLVGYVGGIGATRSVLETLVHPQVREPRHAIRLVNAFLTDYGLAHRRERPSPGRAARIAPGEVTGFPLELARLVVLRSDHRTLYDRIRRETVLLSLLDDALLGSQDALNDPLLRDFLKSPDLPTAGLNTDEWPGLAYLRATAWRTRNHRPPQLNALITLGSTPASRDLGSENAQAIALELQQRDSEALGQRLVDVGQRRHVLGAVRNTLAGLRPGLALDNAVAATVLALGSLPDLIAAAPEAGAEAARPELTALTEQLARRRVEAPDAVPIRAWVPLLSSIPAAYLSLLVEELTAKPGDPDEAGQWASALLDVPADMAFAPMLAGAVEKYFADLTVSGSELELERWTEPGRHRESWPASAYGALLAMAASHGTPDTLDFAVDLARTHAQVHRWDRNVIRGLMTDWDTVSAVCKQRRVAVLDELVLPADSWGQLLDDEALAAVISPTAAPRHGVTLGGWLACQLAQFLHDDEDMATSLRTQELLEKWLPTVGPQPAPNTNATCNDVIFVVFAQVALTGMELAQAMSRLLPRLPQHDGAGFMTLILTQLRSAQPELDADILTTIFTMLASYLQATDDAESGPVLRSAQMALDVLVAPLPEDSDAGRLARLGLSSVLATKRGAARAGQLVATLAQHLPVPMVGPAPLSGVHGELLVCLHTLLADPSTRQSSLPAILERLQASVNQGHVAAPVDFAARYLDDPQIHQFWIAHIDQQWASVTPQSRDLAVRGAERQDVRDSSLGTRLASHIPHGNDAVWAWAARLWPRAERQVQVDMLAVARGRCPDLASHAAQIPGDMLTEAIHRAGDHIEDLFKLCADNPALNASLTSYMQSLIHSGDVDAHLVRVAVDASTDPAGVWDMALRTASEDQYAARRAAAVIGALAEAKPASAPADLVSRLAPVIYGADPEATRALGAAVASLPRKVRQGLSDAIPREGQPRGRRTEFRKAAGL
ncbi:P-loop NTPase fold protein [Kitasatospora sp. NPDC048722]|uniref:P-loop NTPase fold protein n=1 Tax=Kitasatospora sp. NPDC048722 TaxID=3155639 RepID=UPI00340FA4D1